MTMNKARECSQLSGGGRRAREQDWHDSVYRQDLKALPGARARTQAWLDLWDFEEPEAVFWVRPPLAQPVFGRGYSISRELRILCGGACGCSSPTHAITMRGAIKCFGLQIFGDHGYQVETALAPKDFLTWVCRPRHLAGPGLVREFLKRASYFLLNAISTPPEDTIVPAGALSRQHRKPPEGSNPDPPELTLSPRVLSPTHFCSLSLRGQRSNFLGCAKGT
jgi:hypothetical protein